MRHVKAAPLAPESDGLLALEAYVALQSRGQPITPDATPALRPFVARGEQLRVAAEPGRPAREFLHVLQRAHHRGMTGQQRAHLDAQGLQRTGQRAHHIGQSPRLQQRVHLRRDTQHLHGVFSP